MDLERIGQRIRTERMKFNLTQERLAEVLGMSAIFIGQIERGERAMSLDTLFKVADCLHVSFDYLLKGEGNSDMEDKSEIEALIERCSPAEKAIIVDMIKVVLPHIRTN